MRQHIFHSLLALTAATWLYAIHLEDINSPNTEWALAGALATLAATCIYTITTHQTQGKQQ